MAVLAKIAWRNLRAHRAKTTIIGTIIALGIASMILGNALAATAARGAQRYFIGNYTGHLMIHGPSEALLSLFGPTVVATGNEEIPRIPRYEQLFRWVAARQEVEALTPQLTAYGLLDFEEQGSAFTVLFGIEPQSYRRMFPGAISIYEGADLQPGEEGILLSENKLREIEEVAGVRLRAGDRVRLNGFGNAGFRIRELPVRGLFRFDRSIQGLSEISFIDAQSLRALVGLTVAGAREVPLSAAETSLLDAGSTEAMFGGEAVLGERRPAAPGAALDEQALLDILGERRPDAWRASLDEGAWHFLLVRLRPEAQPQAFLSLLRRHFEEEGLGAAAVDWRVASGGIAALAELLRAVFNAAILIVAVVAIIIIMNILLISVIERTAEIGTMRALGARRALIRRLFILETLSISAVFGAAGIAAACLAVGILRLTGVPAPNPFFEMLFGGPRLYPILPWSSLLYALAVVAVIGVVASLYPVGVALRIRPVRAIQTE